MKKLILLLLFVVPLKLLAQTTINGTVYAYENKALPLEKVIVKNLTNHQAALTKASGQFSIAAKAGDVLELSLAGYHTDTLYLTDSKPKTVYLPSNATNLKEVNIITAKISPDLNTKDPEAKSYTRVSTDDLRGKKNNDRAGGLIFSLGYGKYKREQTKLRDLEEREKYENEIELNFNQGTVSDLVKLKGQDLKDFITTYKPSVARVKSERPFNYPYYIAQAYHAWLKLPPGQRKVHPMQKLKAN